VVRAGDEVIVLDPCYDSYEPAIDPGRRRALCTSRWRPRITGVPCRLAAVRDAITPHTRMLMINSPHNPTGAVLSRADLDTLAELLRNTDIVLLSDEVYEHIVFDGAATRACCAIPNWPSAAS
jgi:methionine aminotransferase